MSLSRFLAKWQSERVGSDVPHSNWVRLCSGPSGVVPRAGPVITLAGRWVTSRLWCVPVNTTRKIDGSSLQKLSATVAPGAERFSAVYDHRSGTFSQKAIRSLGNSFANYRQLRSLGLISSMLLMVAWSENSVLATLDVPHPKSIRKRKTTAIQSIAAWGWNFPIWLPRYGVAGIVAGSLLDMALCSHATRRGWWSIREQNLKLNQSWPFPLLPNRTLLSVSPPTYGQNKLRVCSVWVSHIATG